LCSERTQAARAIDFSRAGGVVVGSRGGQRNANQTAGMVAPGAIERRPIEHHRYDASP
jgi:hypothetical protein